MSRAILFLAIMCCAMAWGQCGTPAAAYQAVFCGQSIPDNHLQTPNPELTTMIETQQIIDFHFFVETPIESPVPPLTDDEIRQLRQLLINKKETFINPYGSTECKP